MRQDLLPWLPVLFATALTALALAPGSGMVVSSAASTQETPTAVPPATPAPPAPTPTFTVTPTAATGPDLTVTLFGSPDPVPSGGDLTYSLLVSNAGTAPSSGTTVFVSIPSGTVAGTVGTNCSLASGGVTCVVMPLSPGGSSGFTFTVNVTALPGNVINAMAIVDPSNLIAELDRTNNTDTATNVVGAPLVGTVTPTATSAPLATVTPGVIVATPMPVQPTPMPPPASTPAPPDQVWLLVVQPSQTYGLDDSPQWIAQPGEWYVVQRIEDGWALAYWEGDSPEWSVWIPVDERVELS